MPRPPRIQYPGAWYHATHRGIDGRDIFLSNQDRRAFLYLLGDLVSRFGVEIHAYCLMGNHYHLLVHTPEANLSAAMQRLDGLYTTGFNARHDHGGALFRGRFSSRLIESEVYLSRVARYVHRNPLGPALVSDLTRYRWSSYPAYVGRAPVPEWLSTKLVLASFDTIPEFRMFVEAGTRDRELSTLESGDSTTLALGAVTATAAMPGSGDSASPDPGCEPSETLDAIESLVLSEFGASAASLRISVRGQRNVPRMAAIALAQHYSGQTIADLADRYGFKNPSSATSAVHRLSQVASGDDAIKVGIEALKAKLDAAQETGSDPVSCPLPRTL